MDSKLKKAFRWHLQHPRRFIGAHGLQCPVGTHAIDAIMRARADVAAGKNRYPAPVKPFPAFGAQNDSGYRRSEKPEAAGLRLVGRVEADCGGRNGIWDDHDSSGWYADDRQDNLGYGLVYQLPGRNGQSRFVAGYAFSDDCGVTLDLSRVYAEPAAFPEPARKSATGYTMGGHWTWQDNPREMDAARDAAFAADSMAQAAAISEREYQTAWRAGAEWGDETADIAAVREEIRDILQDLRQLRCTSGYPALCKVIAARVRDLLADMQERRNRRDELARGERKHLIFWPGDKCLAAAFNDGAGEQVLPA